MSYTLLRTDKFSDQLNDILLYIAEDAGSSDPALAVLDQIEQDVLRLKEYPESGSLPRYAALRRRGYRVLVTGRWLVFYKTDPARQSVILYAIVDQRREYMNLL